MVKLLVSEVQQNVSTCDWPIRKANGQKLPISGSGLPENLLDIQIMLTSTLTMISNKRMLANTRYALVV